jgi:ADP-ribose pyrophosphatase YjhB (NUDIX family)
MYHLNLLIKKGYLIKNGTLYDLTTIGRRYIDKLSLKKFQPRIQPKIVTLLVCQNNKKEFLLYRRHRQPFFNMLGFPYGKVHLGETLASAAAREFTEKTGLKGKLTHRGDVYIAVNEQGELLTHTLFHVFSGTQMTGKLKSKSSIGDCLWSKFPTTHPTELMPGIVEIYKLLQKHPKTLFWDEYRFDFDYPVEVINQK